MENLNNETLEKVHHMMRLTESPSAEEQKLLTPCDGVSNAFNTMYGVGVPGTTLHVLCVLL